MKKTLPDIFREVQKAETKEDKLKLIQLYYSVSVAACLSMLFNPKIKFNLPEGIPEGHKFNNTPNMSLERAIRSFPTFVTGTGPKLEMAWLRLMNSISEEEARFAFALKDKSFETGLTQADIHEAYPQLIPAPEEATVIEKFQEDPKVEEGAGEGPVDGDDTAVDVPDVDQDADSAVEPEAEATQEAEDAADSKEEEAPAPKKKSRRK